MKDLNQQFKELEAEYLEKRNENKLAEMHAFILLHLKRKTIKYCREKKIFIWDFDEKMQDGADWFMARYLTDQTFRCGKFTSYLHFAFLKCTQDRKQIAEDRFLHQLHDLNKSIRRTKENKTNGDCEDVDN